MKNMAKRIDSIINNSTVQERKLDTMPKLQNDKSVQSPKKDNAKNNYNIKAEEVLSKKQAGFRADRSTVKKLFKIRLLNEKFPQYQK